MSNNNQNKKYILFSPIGTHDPIGVSKDGVPSEGSMLHIIRHYKPSIVYLYITKELNYEDNRYETAIKKFYPICKHYQDPLLNHYLPTMEVKSWIIIQKAQQNLQNFVCTQK